MIYKHCRFDNLKDNSRVGMIDDKIQAYTVMNGSLSYVPKCLAFAHAFK